MIEDSSRFFRYLWRFNALAIAIGSLIVIAIAATVLGDFFRSAIVRHNVDKIASEPEAAVNPARNVLHIGTHTPLEGTPFIAIEATNEVQDAMGTSMSKGVGGPVNLGFLNQDTGQLRWLLPKSVGQLNTRRWIEKNLAASTTNEPKVIVGGVFQVYDEDRNGDGYLTDKDGSSLILDDLTGQPAKVLMKGADGVNEVLQTTDEKLLVSYSKDAKSFVEVFSWPSGQSLSKTEVALP